MSDDALGPSRGLNVLHLFCSTTPLVARESVRIVVDEAMESGLQIVPVAILGAKADLCFMALGRDVWELRGFQTMIQTAGLQIPASYVSVTEVSEYAAGMPEEMLNERLYPKLPPEGKSAFCFYPMTKRRGETHNWYQLPYEERERIMREHGASGRNFRGRVLQLVTGSTGLDNYEWGVTLFGVHMDDLKECVYSMRYDEGSALYGEFGEFYTGMVGELDEVLDITFQ